MRRALPVVLAGLLVLASAGCSTSSEANVVPVRDVAPTKAQAQAAAKAINLVAADLPLYAGKPNRETARTRAYEAKLRRCLGLPNPTKGVVADVDSLDFTKQTRQVSSTVTVFSSTKAAAADVELLGTTKAANCLRNLLTSMFRSELGGSGLVVGTARLTKATTTLPGTEGLRGYDVSFPVSGPGLRSSLEVSMLAFAVKHCEVALFVADLGAPFPREQRDGLLSTLIDNAAAKAV